VSNPQPRGLGLCTYQCYQKSFWTVTVVIASVKAAERWDQGHTSASLLHQSAMWHRAVNLHCFYTSAFLTSCFLLSAMDGKIEQHVCIKFCMNLGKSATETLVMLREAFGGHRTAVFECHSCFKAVSSVSWRWWMFRVTKHQQNDRKCFKNLKTSPQRPSPNNPWARRHLWDQLWSFPGDLNNKIWTCAAHPPTLPWKPQSLWLTTTWLLFPILPTRRT
jgi:hypothetical protein